MSDIAIKVENLSKSYFVGHNIAHAERNLTLRDTITGGARNLLRKTHDMFHGKAIIQGDEIEEFSALDNINFEIKKGERVGIIGRNGAGKSTLLKVLSRIIEPTTGRISINGRIASLLEVGTGFHPELSGRENIILNGTILGMNRKEIQRKFDEIVEFSEIEKFLDTPVKRYSSGMYVRLAFSVAAHLEPEILIVDEVLAVGDIQFQDKCLGKMESAANEGRTVIFVSHNLSAIRSLCQTGLLFEKGNLIVKDNIHSCIEHYLNKTTVNKLRKTENTNEYIKNDSFGLIKASLTSTKDIRDNIYSGEELTIKFIIRKATNFINPEFGIGIKDNQGKYVICLNNNHLGKKISTRNKNECIVSFTIPKIPIYTNNKYYIDIFFGDVDISYQYYPNTLSFTLNTTDVYNSGRPPKENENTIWIENIEINTEFI